jgi:hypothetical protein
MDYLPAYRITVTLPDGRYRLQSLQALNSGLTTALAVGGLDLTLADPAGEIGRVLGRTRHGLPVCLMAPITAECRNVWGEWDTAWTGYITSAGPTFEAQQGHLYHITAGDGLKPFEVQTQSAADVVALTLANLSNVSASSVLRYAAGAIGLPAGKLNIHVQADAGSGIQTDIPPTTFISPQQSSWLAILNGVAQFTGNILFADEDGAVNYRPIDYSAPPLRSIPAGVVTAYALASSDEELATLVEVRYGLLPVSAGAPRASAPASWKGQLKERKYITYMPWLQAASAAQWAATTLLRQGMAQLGVGQVTLLGDHAYRVGDTVRLGFAGKDAFIQTVTQQWQWGGNWLTTLGLTFVRDAGATLPTTVVPSNLRKAGFPDPTQALLTVPEQQSQSLSQSGTAAPLTLVLEATASQAAIPHGSDMVGPASLFTTGSLLIVRDAATNGPIHLGATRKALSSVAASATAADGTLLIYDPKHALQTEQVVVTVSSVPGVPLDVGATYGTGPTPPAPPPPPAAVQAIQNTRSPAPGSYSTFKRYVPSSQPSGATYWRDKVLQTATRVLSMHPVYQPSGWDLSLAHLAFSCVAFIGFVFRTSGFAGHLAEKYPKGDSIALLNRLDNPIYDQHVLFTLSGNTPVDFGAIQPGDILFFSGTDPDWAGQQPEMFSHAALAYGPYSGPATNFNRNGPGSLYTLTTQIAMIGAQNKSQGITYQGLASTDRDGPYWQNHYSAAMRPDYST